MDTVDFGSLYERHVDDVLRFAFYLTGNRAEAEDIASETFVRAWVARDAIRVRTVKAYLFLIARNLCRMEHRRGGRAAALEEEPPAPGASPARSAEDRGQLRVVLEWMQRLPEVDRAALVMRAHGELSYEEISSALGISVAAARVKVHRARLGLSELQARSGADR